MPGIPPEKAPPRSHRSLAHRDPRTRVPNRTSSPLPQHFSLNRWTLCFSLLRSCSYGLSRNLARAILRSPTTETELNSTRGLPQFSQGDKSCTGACRFVEPVWDRQRKGFARGRPWRWSGSLVGNKFLFPCDPKLRYREWSLLDRALQNLRFEAVAVCAARRHHIHRFVRPTRPRDGTGHIWAQDCCALHCRQPSRCVPSPRRRLVLDS